MKCVCLCFNCHAKVHAGKKKLTKSYCGHGEIASHLAHNQEIACCEYRARIQSECSLGLQFATLRLSQQPTRRTFRPVRLLARILGFHPGEGRSILPRGTNWVRGYGSQSVSKTVGQGSIPCCPANQLVSPLRHGTRHHLVPVLQHILDEQGTDGLAHMSWERSRTGS